MRNTTGLPRGLIEDAAVEQRLRRHVGQLRPRHEGNFGAIKPDPVGAGRIELRQVELQSRVQHQPHFGTAARHRRQIAHGGIGRLFVGAGAQAGGEHFLQIVGWAHQQLAVVAIDDHQIHRFDLASASFTRPITGISSARATIATCMVGEPSSSTNPRNLRRS